MNYYFTKVLNNISFEEAIISVTNELQKEGFGVLTEIDVKATLKKKLDVDFRNYRILGACNPGFAHKALQSEDKIGVFLPCNVVVQEQENGEVEVTAVDPVASMISVKNNALEDLALDIQKKLLRVIERL